MKNQEERGREGGSEESGRKGEGGREGGSQGSGRKGEGGREQARSQGGFGGFDRTPHFGECILRSTVSTLYATRVWPETEFTYTQYRAM